MCQRDPWTHISKAQSSSSSRCRLTLLTIDCFIERKKRLPCLLWLYTPIYSCSNQSISSADTRELLQRSWWKSFLICQKEKVKGTHWDCPWVLLLLAGATAASRSKGCTSLFIIHKIQTNNTQCKQRLLHCMGWILPPDTPFFLFRITLTKN